MPTPHTVKQGEHLTQIAQKYGFRDLQTIWNDSANAELKSLRKNPNVLYPGDVLQIPDKTERKEARPTTNVHTFQVKSRPLKLSLVLRDFHQRPLANTECQIEVDGVKKTVTTDADGRFIQPIPPAAAGGRVTAAGVGLDVPLMIGHLDPVDTQSGQVARLANMGYYRLPLQGDPDEDELDSAIQEFQCDNNLTVDGDCGPATQAKLKEIHGC